MPRGRRRILLRSGKSPFDALRIEDALQQNVIATNAGNLIFSDATHKILSTPGTEVASNGMHMAAPERINEEYDAFVIPLANAFRPSFERHLRRMTRVISKLKIPVVVVGVGAQAGVDYNAERLAPIEPVVRRFVSAVLDRSASIGVRGEFTEQYLKGLGFRDVEVIGCPSLFFHGEHLHIDKGDELTPESRVAVNGSHGAVRNKHLAALLKRTYETYPDVRFIGQNLSEARQLHWRDMSDPNSSVTGIPTHPSHPLYRDDKVRVYVDPATWIRELSEFDFSFGSRIHGNIAALLAGTPCTVLCGDARTLELARYFEIPHHKLAELPSGLDAADLFAAADFGPLMKGHKERFLRFTGFLAKNGLENTFEHGDGGAEFKTRMSELSLPPAVRPWNDADITSVSARFNWLHSQLDDVTKRNAHLERALAKGPAATVEAAARPSVYRRARRAVGRPIRRALKSRGA